MISAEHRFIQLNSRAHCLQNGPEKLEFSKISDEEVVLSYFDIRMSAQPVFQETMPIRKAREVWKTHVVKGWK